MFRMVDWKLCTEGVLAECQISVNYFAPRTMLGDTIWSRPAVFSQEFSARYYQLGFVSKECPRIPLMVLEGTAEKVAFVCKMNILVGVSHWSH